MVFVLTRVAERPRRGADRDPRDTNRGGRNRPRWDHVRVFCRARVSAEDTDRRGGGFPRERRGVRARRERRPGRPRRRAGDGFHERRDGRGPGEGERCEEVVDDPYEVSHDVHARAGSVARDEEGLEKSPDDVDLEEDGCERGVVGEGRRDAGRRAEGVEGDDGVPARPDDIEVREPGVRDGPRARIVLGAVFASRGEGAQARRRPRRPIAVRHEARGGEEDPERGDRDARERGDVVHRELRAQPPRAERVKGDARASSRRSLAPIGTLEMCS